MVWKIGFGVLGMLGLLFLIIRLYIYSSHFQLRRYYFPFLSIKVLAGISLGLIYFHFYGSGDTTAYHHDAMVLSELAFQNFGEFIRTMSGRGGEEITFQLIYHDQPRALIFSKFLSFVYTLSFQNYWLAGIYLSFFSFTGLWFLAEYLLKSFKLQRNALALSFFLFPSFVFWSSGVLKESIMIGSMGFLLFVVLKTIEERSFRWDLWLGVILFIGTLWVLKYYYAAILVPILFTYGLICFMVDKKSLLNHKLKFILTYIFIFVGVVSLATLLHPNLHFDRVLQVLVENYETISEISRPGNTAIFEHLAPNVTGLLKTTPEAIITGLFRPFIWEANNWLSAWVGIENLFLFIATLFAFSKIGKIFNTPAYLAIVAVLVFILSMSVLLSISSPNFGSLARFRVGYLPFFILLITHPIFVFLRKETSNK